MTIRLPPDNILDRILAIFGKKRGIILPSTHAEPSFNEVDTTNPYLSLKARKESFIKALFKSSGNDHKK